MRQSQNHFLPLLITMLGVYFSGSISSHAQEPCDLFDHNGDGFIGANTWVYVLGQYDTQGSTMDVDNSGWVDVRDLLTFIPFSFHACPAAWHDTTYNHISGLALVQWAEHDSLLTGIIEDLPAGSTSYRLYAQFTDETDKVLAIFGDEDAPLHIETDGAFYQFGGEFGTLSIDDYTPGFDALFPANAYTTWLSSGNAIESQGLTSIIYSEENPILDATEPGVISYADSTGGAWFESNLGAVNQDDLSNLALLGQFTVMNGSTLEGTINLLAQTTMEVGHGIELAEGLTFSSDDLDILGCTDPEAMNYDPTATIPYGDCFYPGDINEDGNIDVTDLLDLLDLFGCQSCPVGDLNFDGVVSVLDILIWLSTP